MSTNLGGGPVVVLGPWCSQGAHMTVRRRLVSASGRLSAALAGAGSGACAVLGVLHPLPGVRRGSVGLPPRSLPQRRDRGDKAVMRLHLDMADGLGHLVVCVRRFSLVFRPGKRAVHVDVCLTNVAVEQTHDGPHIASERAELGRYPDLRSSGLRSGSGCRAARRAARGGCRRCGRARGWIVRPARGPSRCSCWSWV